MFFIDRRYYPHLAGRDVTSSFQIDQRQHHGREPGFCVARSPTVDSTLLPLRIKRWNRHTIDSRGITMCLENDASRGILSRELADNVRPSRQHGLFEYRNIESD